jgi:hypothetical protein
MLLQLGDQAQRLRQAAECSSEAKEDPMAIADGTP